MRAGSSRAWFPPTSVATGLASPQGVAADEAGNIYISDTNNHRVLNVQRSSPPALVFTPTLVGGTNGPQTVTISNIGNQPLIAIAPGLTIGAGFQQEPGGTSPPCNPTFQLNSGERCDLSLSFFPQTAGSFKSTAALTDNALNGAPATQTVNLSGTSMYPTTTTAHAASGTYSDPVTLTAVVAQPSSLAVTGSLQFLIDGAPACSVAVTGSGTYSCRDTISQAPGGRAALTAKFISSDPRVQGRCGVNTLTVAPEDATLVPSPTNPLAVTVLPIR